MWMSARPRSEPAAEVPKPNGQEHHVMSKKVADAAAEHPVLKGKIKYRDPRYVTRAMDKEAHRGYQPGTESWMRKLQRGLMTQTMLEPPLKNSRLGFGNATIVPTSSEDFQMASRGTASQ